MGETLVRLKHVTAEHLSEIVGAHVSEHRQLLLDVMGGMGFSMLTNVPAGRYNELYTRWRRALREVGAI